VRTFVAASLSVGDSIRRHHRTHRTKMTIHSGQTQKSSVRANVFRMTLESGHRSMQSACLKGAKDGGGAWLMTRPATLFRRVASDRYRSQKCVGEKYGRSEPIRPVVFVFISDLGQARRSHRATGHFRSAPESRQFPNQSALRVCAKAHRQTDRQGRLILHALHVSNGVFGIRSENTASLGKE
jgi:hypothetical protein